MCLRIYDRDITVKEADSDKTFYKVIAKNRYGHYVSPYIGADIAFDLELCDADQENFVTNNWAWSTNFCEIGYGGFHLFTKKEDAEFEVEMMKTSVFRSPNTEYFIAKAIVPKGTKYVEGFYGDRLAVVAKKVKYTKID